MRWSGQQILDHGVGAAAALPGMRGLLRTVRTPEFAGTVFHEVEAKSALNRVPGDSPVPFRWTVNPYRGCSHACVYCLGGETPVLLADGRTRPISELRAGDAVLGTEVVDGRRRYVRTRVLAHWSTTKRAYRVRLAGGTELLAGGEHRFLTADGWRHVSGGWCRAGRRRRLRIGSELLGPGAGGATRQHTPGYRRGYLCGLIRADGTAAAGRSARSTHLQPSEHREPPEHRELPEHREPPEHLEHLEPSEHLELEALGRVHHFLATESGLRAAAPLGTRTVAARRVAVRSARQVEAGRIAPMPGAAIGRALTAADDGSRRVAGPPPIADVVRWPTRPGDDWCAGFLAGVVDACGDTARGELRIRHPDQEIIGRVAGACHRLGFRFRMEREGSRPTLRLLGGVTEFRRFGREIDPAVFARTDLGGAPVGGAAALRVQSIVPAGTRTLYDITTGTGDFVADGVVSHNCFARNSHTYLDLDAGADFDSQIVVKVNIARVLERELRSARWAREPVAMGTNTDPYQRAEGRYRLMPGVITALARSGTPFSLLTKGTVITRDIPELASAAADVPVRLGVSIALLDRELQAGLEPGTPAPAARLDLVRRLTDAGLPCAVMVAPVLPLLTDSDEQLDALLARIAAAGADGASVLALHLRPGTREWFLAWLQREHPRLVEPYARLYHRGAYVDPEYRKALGGRVAPLLARHGLSRPIDGLREQQPGAGQPGPPAPPGGEQLRLL